MRKPGDGLTRGEFLRLGLLGIAAATIPPTVSSCTNEKATPLALPEPEEPLEVGYREVGGFSPGFHVSRDLAVRGRDAWIAGDMAVWCFRKGVQVASYEVGGAAQAVDVAPDGALYATLDDRVVDFSSGRAASWESLGPRARLVEIVATDDSVFVADAGNRRIMRFGRDGRLRNLLGTRDEAHDYIGLIVPSPYLGMAILRSGDLAVCNPGQHRIEVHSAAGGLQKAIGKNGQDIGSFCGCCNPMSLAPLEDGDLVTAEKGIPRIKVIGLDGDLRTVVAPPSAFDPKTTGLKLAVQGGRVWVLDPWKGMVRVFEPIRNS